MNKKIVIGIAIIIALAIGVILFFVFSSEKQPVGNPPTVEGQDYFNARVTSVNDKYILAECMENDSGAIKVGTELSISCNTVSSEEFPDLVVGDYIRVVYAGAILEKNPPSFQQIISVFKINEEGAVLEVNSFPLESEDEATDTIDGRPKSPIIDTTNTSVGIATEHPKTSDNNGVSSDIVTEKGFEIYDKAMGLEIQNDVTSDDVCGWTDYDNVTVNFEKMIPLYNVYHLSSDIKCLSETLAFSNQYITTALANGECVGAFTLCNYNGKWIIDSFVEGLNVEKALTIENDFYADEIYCVSIGQLGLEYGFLAVTDDKEIYYSITDKYNEISYGADILTRIKAKADTAENAEGNSENVTEVKYDLIPMVLIDGELYLDTGKSNGELLTSDIIIGEITSSVDGSKKPTENNQSNFGSGYYYRYGEQEGTVEIVMNGKWWIYTAE